MLNVPLAVRLTSSAGDKHVTRRLRDLSFRSVVPGGYASATLTFDQPLSTTDPAVAIYGRCYIIDGRTGAIVWEGRQEDPGRGASSDGQVWTLNCFGPSVHAEDRLITVCYVDTGVEAWQPAALGRRGASVGSTDDDPASLKVQFNQGLVLATNNFGAAINRIVRDCGGKLARFKVAWDAGKTDANYQVNMWTRAGLGALSAAAKSAAFNTAGGTLTAVITTDFTSGDDVAYLGIQLTGVGATVADDTTFGTGDTIVVQQTRYTAAGTEQTTGATYASDTVLASDVVKDLLGRVLTQFDGATATVDTGTHNIDRLSYTEPTTPGQILEDLMALEPCFWRCGPSNASGKHSFEWVQWPTTVRYEASIQDSFDSPGSVGDLFNAVLVRGRDRNGRPRNVRRTMAQTDLDNAGLIREGLVDLGDSAWSTANAQRAGDRFLADHNSPPNAGTLAISTPILDLTAGRMVQPWEIQPGNLIRVRGVLPRVDALNATDRDAVTVFRLMSTDYAASSNTCTAGLDAYSRSMANQVFAAHRRLDRLRKR